MSSTPVYKTWDICIICTGMGTGFKEIIVERADQNARASTKVCAECYYKMKQPIPVFSNKYVKTHRENVDLD